MRISSGYEYSVMANDIDTSQTKMFTAQQQVATGIQISQASDNPYGTEQILQMSSLQSSLTQYQSNLQQATSDLGTTSNALTSTSSLLQSAYQLGLQVNSGTTDTTSEASMVQQINTLQSQLLSLANTQNASGQYVFAGTATSTQPFTVSNGTITYNGDTGTQQVQGGPTDTVTTNIQADSLYTNAYNALQGLKNDVQSGSVSAVSNTDIANIQSSMSAIDLAQGTVGSRVQQVQSLTTANTSRITDLTTQISDLQNVNEAQAMTNYTQAQTAYQAALSMASQTGSLSLATYLTGTLG